MLTLTPKGLYCPAGNFHIDPCGAVDNAVVTHAHSDHARRGGKNYFCARSGVELLKNRLGKKISVRGLEFGEKFFFNHVQVSLHPAGHILGSAQVRVQIGNEVWVASGDYKRDPDPTCEPFEPVPCDVFITEATFGTPGFRWDKTANLGLQIHDWWQTNAAQGANSVLFAYSLGKAQRVLGLLEPYAERSIYCHPAVMEMNQAYQEQGIALAPSISINEAGDAPLTGELFLVPPAFLKGPQAGILGERFETAFASGWTAQSTHGFDKGFVLSDHADWDDLVRTVRESQARRVYVQHRGKGALVRHLRSLGLQAAPDTDLIPVNPDQLSFF